MRRDAAYNRAVGASVGLSLLVYGLASGRVVLGFLALGAAAMLWWITDGGRGRAAPRGVANTLLLGVALFTATGLGDGRLDVDDFTLLIVGLVLVKLVDRRHPRDEGQLLALTGFLAAGAVITSSELIVGLGLMLFIPALLVAVARFHVSALAPRDSQPAPGLARSIGALGLVAVGVAGAVFVLFPRGVGQDAFGRWGSAAVGQETGFVDEVRLGLGGRISTVETPVIDLRIEDSQRRSVGAPGEVYYLRGAVLDRYEQGEWTRSPVAAGAATVAEYPADTWVRSGSSTLRAPSYAIVDMRDTPRGEAHHLFTVHEVAGFRFDSAQRVAVSWRDGQARRLGTGGRLRYEIAFDRSPSRRAPAPERARIRASFDSEVVRQEAAAALATRGLEVDPLVRSTSDDALAVRAIESHLRENFEYTLETLAAPPGDDPIDWFLTEARRGHCEYYAAAMAAMCRSIGVDARVVTGYVATEFNAQTQLYTVRRSNAHAWVEAEPTPGFWRTYDPTPPADFRAIHAPDVSLASRARRWLEAIEYAWIQSIVSYEGPSARSASGPDRARAERGSSGRSRGGASNPQAAPAWVVWGVGLSAAAVVLVVVLRGFRRRTRARLGSGVRFYDDALAALRRGGLAKPEHRPPVEHAARISAAHPEAGAAFDEIARAFYRVRFGDAALSREEQDRLRALTGKLGRSENHA